MTSKGKITSYRAEKAREQLPAVTFGPKVSFGKAEYNMKVSKIRCQGKVFEIDVGVSPIQHQGSLETVTTDWGINYFVDKKKEPQQQTYGFGAGNPAQGYGAWGQAPGAPPPPGMPGGQPYPGMPGAAPYPGAAGSEHSEREEEEDADESKLPLRRNFDIVLQHGSDINAFFDEFDERVKDEARARSQEWFKQNFSEELFQLMYTRSVRVKGEDQTLSVSTKTFMPDLNVFLYDRVKKVVKACDYKTVKKGLFLKVTVFPEHVWFQYSGKSEAPVKGLGVLWKTKSILVFPETAVPTFNFHMEDEYVLDDAVDAGNTEDSAEEPIAGAKRKREESSESSEPPQKRACDGTGE